MQTYLHTIGLCLALSILSNAHAEVILDGSWGGTDTLNGPNFDIRAELGHRMGNNLFHSFQTFNLNAADTATFSGPDSIRNVISRVTGGSVSTIDGTLRSLMPQADMYFLNPAGIIIGEHAQIDVQGAMHFSTADELYLGEDGKFTITNPQDSLLTIAPPSAFGFFSDSPAAITFQGGQLSVSEGNTFSVIGGDINFQPNSLLRATEGRINLASVASAGKVIPTPTSLNMNNFTQRGNLTVKNTTLDVGGQKAGSIYIRADQFLLKNSEILGKTADEDAGVTDIAVTDLTVFQSQISNSTNGSGKGGNIMVNAKGTITINGSKNGWYGLFANSLPNSNGDAGQISITAKNLHLSDYAQIASSTFGIGQGGSINLKTTDSLTLSNASVILTASESEQPDAGNAGIISIQADHLVLKGDDTEINNVTWGTGQGGAIVIDVTGNITLSGGDIFAGSISRETEAGNGGVISIRANQLFLIDEAQIASATFGSGKSGTITINAADTISLEGYIIEDEKAFSSAISVSTYGSGDAGAVKLTTKHLQIKGGGGISNVTYYGAGQGGDTFIEATDSITISAPETANLSESQVEGVAKGITSASQRGSTGNAGKIVLNTPLLILTNGGEITTAAETAQGGEIELNVAKLQVYGKATITSASKGAGDAGHIRINASDRIAIDDGTITTQAAVAAGGNIIIKAPNLLDLREGAITTSVQGGSGDGGNIILESPTFVVLDQGQIKAQAYQGHGGNIRIIADKFIASPDSLVSASSQLGIDGEVNIESPSVNLDEFLVVLPGGFFERIELDKPCQIKDFSELSTFSINTSREGMPMAPAGFQE